MKTITTLRNNVDTALERLRLIENFFGPEASQALLDLIDRHSMEAELSSEDRPELLYLQAGLLITFNKKDKTIDLGHGTFEFNGSEWVEPGATPDEE